MSQNVNFGYRLAAFGAAFSVILSVGWFYFPANKSSLEHSSQNIPKYWTVCVWQWNQNGNLRTMNRVFERLGFEFVNASNGDDWDVLWGIEFPFYEEASQLYDPIWPTLKPHQRINHIPGMNHLTSKAYMTTENDDLKFILPSFVDSDKFKDYVATHPDKKFIEKNFANRGVQIIDAKNLDFKADLIYQEFMEKPFLIDERTFDLGVFVLITSIDPLRVYRFKNEILLRFCPEPYYPFDETNEDKFVIQESNIHYLQMPSLKRYCEKYGFSGKMAFEDHLLKQGHSVEKLWTDIDEAITILIARNERFFIKYTFETYNFTSSHHFFELLRFDFILDEDLNVFLMEANMSPNLTPSYEKFEGNALTNEQVVHDTLKLIGAGSYMELMSIYNQKSDEMISNFKNTAVDPASCVDNECYKSCETAACRLCTTCLSLKEQQSLHHAYREYIRRGEFKRIFPSEVHFEPTAMAKMSTQNEISAHWFKAKCKESKDWC